MGNVFLVVPHITLPSSTSLDMIPDSEVPKETNSASPFFLTLSCRSLAQLGAGTRQLACVVSAPSGKRDKIIGAKILSCSL